MANNTNNTSYGYEVIDTVKDRNNVVIPNTYKMREVVQTTDISGNTVYLYRGSERIETSESLNNSLILLNAQLNVLTQKIDAINAYKLVHNIV